MKEKAVYVRQWRFRFDFDYFDRKTKIKN